MVMGRTYARDDHGRFASTGGSGGGGGKPKVNMAKYNATRGSMPRQRTTGGDRHSDPPKIDLLKNPYRGTYNPSTTVKRPLKRSQW